MYEAYEISVKWQRFRARLASSHELQLQILNAGVFCILSSSLVPLLFSIFLRSSATKLTHLSLNYLMQFN